MKNQNPYFTTIGDVGVDRYPTYKKNLPGGTALNSAIYAAKAGAQAAIVSAVGNDELASIPLHSLKEYKVDLSHLEILEGKTDIVDIELDPEGRPQYSNWDLGVLEGFRLKEHHQKFLESQHLAIAVHLPELKPMFDDFAKMNLKKTIKIADFTDLSEYNGDISVINMYAKQFDILALSIDASDKDRLAAFYDIAQEHKRMAIALMGKDGSAVYDEDNLYYQEAKKVTVADTTGAGDAYLSTFLVQYVLTQDITFSMEKATQVASQTIQHIGAIE